MTARRAGGGGGLSSRIVFLAVEDEPRHQKCAGTGHVRIDPQGLAEMIREGLLMVDLDLSVRFARRSFGDAFTVTPKDTPRDQEGQQ